MGQEGWANEYSLLLRLAIPVVAHYHNNEPALITGAGSIYPALPFFWPCIVGCAQLGLMAVPVSDRGQGVAGGHRSRFCRIVRTSTADALPQSCHGDDFYCDYTLGNSFD